jgi:undecaprenyl diphosphate synthase
MNLENEINKDKLPKHLAIIMDGNGRWAKQQGKLRAFGHENGTKSVRTTVEACAKLGIEYLTLYAFSTENWNRPKLEVEILMKLLISSLKKELKTLQENNIKLHAIGNLNSLPTSVKKELLEVIDKTKNNSKMTFSPVMVVKSLC